ncbi:MAG: DUF6542 domain-containing protein [Nocardioidaceae bacterium]
MSQSSLTWARGRESGRHAVALGLAVALTVVVVDLLLVGRLSLFFDLSFVALCLGLAFVVRLDDFFTVGVLPPLIMVAVFTLLALVSPGTIAHPGDGLVQAVVTGLATHSAALAAGYALCLATLAVRQRQAR